MLGGQNGGKEATSVFSGRSTLSFLDLGGGAHDGGINLLAGMGLTDDQYRILRNMVGDGMMDDGMNGVGSSTEKRTLEDVSGGEDGQSRKRSHFETI